MNLHIDNILDATGLMCPEPVMLLHKAVRGLGPGCVMKVITTDPSTLRDVPKFCQFLGYELVAQEQDGQSYFYYIKKPIS
jgi:tRNA 2-thiouridine synthesizing protein A